MKIDKEWIKRRWLEFRWGHGTYLAFFLSFANFVMISYNFMFETVFKSMALFAITFCLLYFPFAVFLGVLHRKYQRDIDVEISQKPILNAIKDLKKEIEDLKKR